MTLSEKLHQARIEAGLSQRQLCGEKITRNMLSQIEHGTARPSMDTLKFLAARLGKPVSFFLDETVVASANQAVMEEARALYDAGDYAGAVRRLEGYRGPDAIFDREQALLNVLARLGWAEASLETGRDRYALEILEGISTAGIYCSEALEHRRLLLLSRLRETILPSLDEELLLRAEIALKAGDADRAGRLLDAAEDLTLPRWSLLRGQVHFLLEEYRPAARCLHLAEADYPAETAQKLEICYREQGDFKRAYEYACKRRGEQNSRQ